MQKAPDFHKLTFERAVDSIRTIAAIHLWKVGAGLIAVSGDKYDLEDFYAHYY